MPEPASVKVTGVLAWAMADGKTTSWTSAYKNMRAGLDSHLHDAAAARAPTKREEVFMLGRRYWFASTLPACEHTGTAEPRARRPS